jgi:hypothetical protein
MFHQIEAHHQKNGGFYKLIEPKKNINGPIFLFVPKVVSNVTTSLKCA